MKLIEPSLLSIDKTKAIEQLKRIKELNIPYVHYDVMDGKFVPPTSFVTEYLKDVEDIGLKANVHLMVQNPNEWIDKYRTFKLNSITFHAETQSVDEAIKLIDKIHQLDFKAGISVKAQTDLNQYQKLLSLCDIVLIMSVEPGWAGQGFVQKSLNNLEKANQAKASNPNLIIQIDGGINDSYIKQLYKQVDWFVTGSWFFKNIDRMGQYLDDFKKLN